MLTYCGRTATEGKIEGVIKGKVERLLAIGADWSRDHAAATASPDEFETLKAQINRFADPHAGDDVTAGNDRLRLDPFGRPVPILRQRQLKRRNADPARFRTTGWFQLRMLAQQQLDFATRAGGRSVAPLTAAALRACAARWPPALPPGASNRRSQRIQVALVKRQPPAFHVVAASRLAYRLPVAPLLPHAVSPAPERAPVAGRPRRAQRNLFGLVRNTVRFTFAQPSVDVWAVAPASALPCHRRNLVGHGLGADGNRSSSAAQAGGQAAG